MNITVNPERQKKAHRVVIAAAVVTATVALLAACSSPGSPQGHAASTAGDIVQIKAFSSVPKPGPTIDVNSLKGKTVYWIPITTQASVFTVEQAAATEALAAAGIKLQLCDGEANPATVAKCVNQAIAAKAGGIISPSIPPEFAQQAYASAIAAGIPLEFVNAKDSSVPAGWEKLAASFPSNFVDQAKINDDLIIKDSGGKANVLMIKVTDSSVTTHAFDVGMKKYLQDTCAGCGIDTVEVGSTTVSNLSAQVSAALVKNPKINYVFPEFDSFSAPVVQAIRQLNKSSSIKVVTMLGQLDGLQRVRDGGAFADTGYSLAALGWNEVDIMLRLMLGKTPDVGAYRTPIRTFTSANIGKFDLTQAGWQSGKWTSDDDFRAMYKSLWSVG
ncbi:sugar ABC transporter substrate-binding protein [Lacisediminihabitans profunda]|uniref:Sugar ABC transporter substrate-binding protein n=1 Tax=Lacisediminihabitans profunda TaxID=2594790 RepID=A0A5C8UPM0_9MICO|nr:substrate-binding domain-containing protein [Lacisediminihabitans profunda]TXN29467.1 sugar ABC transporter substrate-binding protein [Lacisediminihabitans profunda]